ncbi:hypothetical protein HON36_03820 [Candidatus Parcubacteria bacterium]|jgi:hypothetical protein|nr:hypothetical protein [Candidatus Parcubacteria bacterium]MBT7228051.1 hypothetical protein [Candidatus Parcubacteria bacterium]
MTKQEACEKIGGLLKKFHDKHGQLDFSMNKAGLKDTSHRLKDMNRDKNHMHEHYQDIFAEVHDGRRFNDHFQEYNTVRTSGIRIMVINGRKFRMGDILLMVKKEIERIGKDRPFVKTTKKVELVGFQGKRPVVSFDGRIVAYTPQHFYSAFKLK